MTTTMLAPETHRVRRSVKAMYGAGNLGITALLAVQSFYLLYFYSDIAKVPIGLASTALGVAKIWDIVNDPLFGWISDRTRSRWGRRRVYLVYGAVPLALVTFALFAIPRGLTGVTAFLVILVTFILFDTALTIVAVPYAALSAELTHDYDERTSLGAYGSVGAVVGFLLGGTVTPMIASAGSDPKVGFILVGTVFGGIAGLTTALVAWRIKEPVQTAPATTELGLVTSVRTALANRPFVRLITSFMLVRFGFTVVSTALAYFVVRQLLRDEKFVGTVIGVMMIVLAVFIPFWKWLSDRHSKTISYSAGLVVTALALAATYLVPQGGALPMLVVMVAVGFGISAHWVFPYTMVADVIEYDQAKTGHRREGMFYGVYGLLDKIARTLGMVAVGGALASFGYDASAPVFDGTLQAIRIMTGPVPALFLLAAVLVLRGYPVTRESHRAVRQELHERGLTPALHHTAAQ